MITLTILENNDLRLAWDETQYGSDENKEHMIEYCNSNGSQFALHEILEDHLGNGWSLFTADQLAQMSETPIISEDGMINDNGDIVLNEKAWFYKDYMITNPVEKILENGFVDFTLWDTFDNALFPFPTYR